MNQHSPEVMFDLVRLGEISQSQFHIWAEALQEPHKGVWIDNNGTPPNIPEWYHLEVKFRDGFVSAESKTFDWQWVIDNEPDDIVAYRIVK
jgi:hypothetical protein